MKLGIYGYGNIGRGVECAIRQNPDMELAGVFTRRSPESVQTLTGAPVYAAADIASFVNDIDAMVICGGSATDLPEMTPMLAKLFNVVDSFDTHARIPEHFAAVDAAARSGGHTALISGGWDPGMFSLNRLYGSVILPEGKDYTFWGRGVSQGHSDAVRRIPGVLDARQYTVPIPEALEAVRSGAMPELSTRQKHRRECYVVAAEGADKAAIERAIVTMPNYFADYDTSVTFISAEEMKQQHSALPHGGMVFRTGRTGLNGEHSHTIEYRLSLDSNPEFTAGVLVALARAVVRMNRRGNLGCKTVFDVAPADLSPLSPEALRATML
ncbi:MAG: diaminopimelate dehydrogenase [Oscillospiraceae bacterium]|nr:diaminopimelate dehydrogenase [Oscillospiraceae bacterium]